MNKPVFTPYDGSQPLFEIGLSPFAKEQWIQIDAQFDAHLAEKDRLLSERFSDVFVEEDGTRESQKEVFELISDHLLAHFPNRYERQGGVARLRDDQRSTFASDTDLPPVVQAARLIQEDLVIMRKSDDGWRLVAGCVCFPSSWNLLEKFGKPLQDIHAPVPAFNRGSRKASVITRIFDNLKTDQPVYRLNWSTYSDDSLFHNSAHRETRRATACEVVIEDLFLRVEYQTLTKLPKTGDILFTIRIFVDPISIIKSLPDAAQAAGGFARLLAMLDRDQLQYKGMETLRDRLIAYCEGRNT